MNTRYSVDIVYFKAPAEHTFNELRYALEIQTEATGDDGTKATLISFLEESTMILNDELAKLNFGKDYYSTYAVKRGEIIEFENAEFNLANLYNDPQDYLMYIGSSTNGNCPSSLVLINQNTGWINRKQMLEFGLTNSPDIRAKQPMENQQIFQNFIIQDPSSSKDPLQVTFDKYRAIPSDFPVPIQYAEVMYVTPKGGQLGHVPKNCIPYWEDIPKGAVISIPSKMPTLAPGYRLIPFCYKPDSHGGYLPQYIVVPNYYDPPFTMPTKIPVAVRSMKSYSNGVRPVMHLDMPVVYTKPTPKSNELPKQKIGPNPSGSDKSPSGSSSPSMGKLDRKKSPPTMQNNIPFGKPVDRKPDLLWPEEMKKKVNKNPENKDPSEYTQLWNQTHNNLTLNPEVFNNGSDHKPDILPDGTIVPHKMQGNLNLTMKRMCETLELNLILNLKNVHKKEFRNLPKEVKTNSYKCMKWNYIKLYHLNTNFTSLNLQFLKEYCTTQVHLILNRAMVPNIADYIAHYCGKQLIHNAEALDMIYQDAADRKNHQEEQIPQKELAQISGSEQTHQKFDVYGALKALEKGMRNDKMSNDQILMGGVRLDHH